jgi:chloramphenicol 3-O phosphotransferase
MENFGKIILVNGASSSGKSTLSRALQAKLEQPFWHYSIDHLLAANILPHTRIKSKEFLWSDLRPQFFAGFHQSLPALAKAGNNLIVEHIVETKEWMQLLLELLAPFDVFYVGIHCPLLELERREQMRGNRRIGEARQDFEIVHTFGMYDLEIDSTKDLDANVAKVLSVWKARKHPSAFETMHRKPNS